MSPPPSARRHRRRGDELPGRLMLLAILATLTVMLGSGTAVTLTAVAKVPEHQVTAGVAGIGPAPEPPATEDPQPEGSAALSASPTPVAPSPTAAPPPTQGSGDPPSGGGATDEILAFEDRVTALTNAERAAAGCDEVRTDDRLRTAARGHSRDMADHDYFSHTGRDGSSPSDRARAAGYDGGVAENIAMGYRTPEDVMRGWMNSEGHRNNLLNCRHGVIGVGLAYDDRGRPYWTQKFGRG